MKKLFPLLAFAVTILFISSESIAQNSPVDMRFQFRDSNGILRDTIMPWLKFRFWSQSPEYPSYVKWKNQPFAILKSSLNGLELFTDSAKHYATGDTIGYAFYKVGSMGRFDLDYRKSNIGSFINNNEDNPNTQLVVAAKGLVLIAKTGIAPNSELTVNYEQLNDLFPNDPTVKKMAKYW